MPRWILITFAILTGAAPFLSAQRPENVLVVANDKSALSRRIAEYYIRARAIPLKNYCHLGTSADEQVSRAVYDREVEAGVRACLGKTSRGITTIVLTQDVPLKIRGALPEGTATDAASVDSELAALFPKLRGRPAQTTGYLANPYFRQIDVPFDQRRFPIFLVARLAAQTFDDVKRMIDASVAVTKNPARAASGKIVIDLKALDSTLGNNWLRHAAAALPKNRVLLDEDATVVEGVKDVIAYAGWGSNDPSRKQRKLGFAWLPGSIATEYVSTNARTFGKPPENWTIGSWSKPEGFFAGSPQSLTSDYLSEGASAATGHVYEPFLHMTPHPEFLLPAYFVKHRTLAEAFYCSVPGLSWQNVLVGDPLMTLRAN